MQLGIGLEALQGEGVFEPFQQRAGRAGVGSLQFARELFKVTERLVVIGFLPGRSQPALDLGAVTLGEKSSRVLWCNRLIGLFRRFVVVAPPRGWDCRPGP